MKILRTFILCLSVAALVAQNPGLQRTILQRKDISVPGREAVIVRVEVAPGLPPDATRIQAKRSVTFWTVKARS